MIHFTCEPWAVLLRASQEKSMTADGSPRTGPGYVCFHSANKIYNPLTLLAPTPTIVFWLVKREWGRGGGGLIEKVCISFTATTGKIRGAKTNKSAKTSQMFRVVAGTRRDGWRLPKMSRTRRPLLHSSQTERSSERGRDQVAAPVCVSECIRA